MIDLTIYSVYIVVTNVVTEDGVTAVSFAVAIVIAIEGQATICILVVVTIQISVYSVFTHTWQ